MKRNWVRKIVGGLSFTSALFVFQACYGTPQDFGYDLFIQGQVKSASTGLPVPGIKVSIDEGYQYQYTDETGNFSFYSGESDSLVLRFEDVDSVQQGNFLSKDTLLTGLRGLSQPAMIHVALAEIQ